MRAFEEQRVKRARSIRWRVVADETAKRLAATQGCSVSELLEDLVIAQAKLVAEKEAA
jgi:hypothetical protein